VAAEVVSCSECGARIAYGTLMPAWRNLPAPDKRFLQIQIGETAFVVDRQLARMAALDILSVCPPPEPEPVDPRMAAVEAVIAEPAAHEDTQ
jgi:hypothetical protein